MAAVPSKHDLASFVRAIHTELALALPAGGRGGLTEGLGDAVESGGAGSDEADLSLAYLLLRGVVSAVKLLCAKVEVMHNVEKASRRQFLGPFLSSFLMQQQLKSGPLLSIGQVHLSKHVVLEIFFFYQEPASLLMLTVHLGLFSLTIVEFVPHNKFYIPSLVSVTVDLTYLSTTTLCLQELRALFHDTNPM